MEPIWFLIGVTFLLVCITTWYAIENHRIVRRMDKEHEETVRPILTFQLIPWQANSLKLRIQNVGSGPALGIRGTIETVMESDSVSVTWSYPILTSDKYEEFGFPMPPNASNEERFRMDLLKSKVNKVLANFAYKSVTGQQYELNESIDIQQVTEDWISSRMMATQDHPERLMPRIAKAIENLVSKK